MGPVSRGFSLIELLLSMLLVGIVLAATAGLFSGFTRLMRHTHDKDRELDTLQYQLDRVCNELSQGFNVTTAPDTVTFERLLPDPPAPNFDPRDPARLQTVTYRLNGDRLERNSETLLEGVSGFGVTLSGNLAVVRITLVEQRVVRTFSGRTYRWSRP